MSYIEAIKLAIDLAEKLKNADLLEALLKARLEGVKIGEENLQLREENQKLREELQLQGALIPEHNAYWMKDDDGKLDGPFCSNCWDVNKLLVRMYFSIYESKHENMEYSCPNCKIGIIKPKNPEEKKLYPVEPKDSGIRVQSRRFGDYD